MVKLVIKIVTFAPVKIIGILAILYFSLYANTEKPQSLGNRITKEELKKGINQAKKTSELVIKNANIKPNNYSEIPNSNKELSQ